MEDRLTPFPRGAAFAVAALAATLAVTAAWWTLALWPVPDAPPEWLVRTRLACFGSPPGGLPDAGGWIVLIGSPTGLLGLLLVVWGDELRVGLGRLSARVAGQLAIGVTAALLVAGLALSARRVAASETERFATSPGDATDALAAARVNDPAPALSLVDQHGDVVELGRFGHRPVVVTFAFAHCQTVCPVVVHDALSARDAEPAVDPAVLIVTLDPWRDTPARLPAVAAGWGVSGDAHVLSGAPDSVEAVLSRWRIPRVRNTRTGDVTHPAVVYVVRDGRIRYALPGGERAIRAAVQAP